MVAKNIETYLTGQGSQISLFMAALGSIDKELFLEQIETLKSLDLNLDGDSLAKYESVF